MSSYEKYRSTRVVEAKQLNHSGTVNGVPFTSGDYVVRDGTSQHIENGELFERTYERVYDSPPDTSGME